MKNILKMTVIAFIAASMGGCVIATGPQANPYYSSDYYTNGYDYSENSDYYLTNDYDTFYYGGFYYNNYRDHHGHHSRHH